MKYLYLAIITIVIIVVVSSIFVLQNQKPLCSNENYETQLTYVGGKGYLISLTLKSAGKLRDEISNKGNEALEGISDLTCLELLEINKKEISDISALNNLVDLRFLDLSYCSVSDISALRNMKKLNILGLWRTEMSDESIDILKTLTNLEKLKIMQTRISEEGCNRLKEALPNTEVSCKLP